jgi:hypothetical protein
MDAFWQMVTTVVCAVFASSGLWAYITARKERKDKKNDKRDAQNAMILGLGHDRIISLCEKYIDRGWIASDEYENLYEWLYKPYETLGGNGTAKRLMSIVDNLPARKVEYTSDGKRIETVVEQKARDTRNRK